MQKWEYLEVRVGVFGFNGQNAAAQFVNDRELKDWKRTALHVFINQLGSEGWEMSSTTSIFIGNSYYQIFFKRSKP